MTIGPMFASLISAKGSARPAMGIGVSSLMLLVLLAGCAGSAPPEAKIPSNDRVSIRTLPWGVAALKWPSAVKIFVSVGFCDGGSKARIVRARPRYAGEGVYIRAEVAFPKVRTPKGVPCPAVGLFKFKTIRLSRDLHEVKLFDASSDPPTLRWP